MMKLTLLLIIVFVVGACVCDANPTLTEKDAITGLGTEELASLAGSSEKLAYKAEVKELMKIIINSIYSNVEVFLREIISNASDALDKIRVAALHDKTVLGGKTELDIRIRADEKLGELHILDTGVGMTKKQLVENLGTIAKSGTKDFVKQLTESSGDASALIGKFGVGFYSAFLVADRVTVISKHNDEDKQYIWQSDAAQNFVVSEDPRGNTLGRGTQVTLHFKKEHMGLLKKLKPLISKYSEFVQFPIYLWESHNETEEVPLSEEELKEEKTEEKKPETDETKTEENVKISEEEEGQGDKKEIKKTKTVTKVVYNLEHVNKRKPIWTRPASEVSQEEYDEFYKHISKDYQNPRAHSHFKAEGKVNFKSICYIPNKPPTDYWRGGGSGGLKLYVRKVFITDDWGDILPKYLGFVKGVVDAEDLDLNVSREVLQQSRTLQMIKTKVVRKILAMIQGIAYNETDYLAFYNQYSKVIKYGIMEDKQNSIRLSKLLRFHSSHNDSMTSLETYVSRLSGNNSDIYFLAGQSLTETSNSPLVEKVKAKNLEVLYLVDPIDEYVMQSLIKFDGKYKLVNVAREGLKLPGDDEEAKEEDEEVTTDEWEDTIAYLKEKLSQQVRKVVISKRLVASPAALVAGSFGLTANMERIAKAQALGDEDPSAAYRSKPVLEVNIKHPILTKLKAIVETDVEDVRAADTANVLYTVSAVSSGYSISDPARFSQRMIRLLKMSLKDVKEAPKKEKKVDEKKVDEKKVDKKEEL